MKNFKIIIYSFVLSVIAATGDYFLGDDSKKKDKESEKPSKKDINEVKKKSDK